ncbi:MAG TPA: hypothetical protein VGX25_18190 [Actinophytocola sp.]|nr:hypothetical protein [Actinophytocola sp.]
MPDAGVGMVGAIAAAGEDGSLAVGQVAVRDDMHDGQIVGAVPGEKRIDGGSQLGARQPGSGYRRHLVADLRQLLAELTGEPGRELQIRLLIELFDPDRNGDAPHPGQFLPSLPEKSTTLRPTVTELPAYASARTSASPSRRPSSPP